MTDAIVPSPAEDRLARGVVTPEGVMVFVRLAGVGERAAALALDLLIMVVALVAVSFVTLASGGHLGLAAGAVLLFVLRSFYFTGFELAWNGRTPGKRMTSLRVINRRGGPLAPASVIGRNLMREVELFMPLSIAFGADELMSHGLWTYLATAAWVLVLAALPLFNRDRLRAGDMIAGTWVVIEPKPLLLPDMALPQGSRTQANDEYRFTEPQLMLYGVKELQVLEEALRSTGSDAEAARREIARRIARKIGYAVQTVPTFDSGRFLAAFYAAQRRRLETELAFGRRRRDKNDGR